MATRVINQDILNPVEVGSEWMFGDGASVNWSHLDPVEPVSACSTWKVVGPSQGHLQRCVHLKIEEEKNGAARLKVNRELNVADVSDVS